MLVGKDRHRTTGSGKDAADLLEKIAPRIEVLFLFVPGIVAVLADNQHAINSQLTPPQTQCRGDAKVDLHTVFARQLFAHIALAPLIHVHRDDIYIRGQQLAVGGKALEEFADNHIGMRKGIIGGGNGGDLLALGHFLQLQVDFGHQCMPICQVQQARKGLT